MAFNADYVVCDRPNLEQRISQKVQIRLTFKQVHPQQYAQNYEQRSSNEYPLHLYGVKLPLNVNGCALK
jgi:hypothetical protein